LTDVSVARLVGERLRAAGVRYVMGHPGGEVVDLIEGFREAGLEFVLTRHEAAAAFMADAMAAATGIPGAPPSTTNPASPRIGEPSGNPGRPTPTDAVVRPAAGPSELYDTAYADYTKGRYALAIQGFQEYLQSYPTTDLSDNAQYWIGESHYAQKKYPEAIADFDRLLKTFPKSDKAPAALLKKGYALLELGQKAEAVVQLQYVIHEHPASQEARLARARLKQIGVEAR